MWHGYSRCGRQASNLLLSLVASISCLHPQRLPYSHRLNQHCEDLEREIASVSREAEGGRPPRFPSRIPDEETEAFPECTRQKSSQVPSTPLQPLPDVRLYALTTNETLFRSARKEEEKLLGKIRSILQKYLSVSTWLCLKKKKEVFYCFWDEDCVF